MIKNLFALIGFAMTLLYVLGLFGIGNFVFYYGPEKRICSNANTIQLKIEDQKR